MANKSKIIIVGLLAALGVGLFCYGQFRHSRWIMVPDEDDYAEILKSEPAFVKLVTIGGAKRDDAGNIKQTFGLDEEAPKACPT